MTSFLPMTILLLSHILALGSSPSLLRRSGCAGFSQRSRYPTPTLRSRQFGFGELGLRRKNQDPAAIKRAFSKQGQFEEDIDISVLWDESKELPPMDDERDDFEEPPEWSKSLVEGGGISVSGALIDEEDDDPFANEQLSLEDFDKITGDGDVISDDLLSFDLEDFGFDFSEQALESKTSSKDSRPGKDDDSKEMRGDEEHVEAISNLALPSSAIKALQKAQRQADKINLSKRKGSKRAERIMEAATGEAAAKVRANPQNRQTHMRLRIVAGTKARKLLVSPKDANVRPMMEKVRAAVFNLLSARFGGGGMLPGGARWLDMFGGTGSVGIEALSRGAESTTFVELDRWVSKNVLKVNLHTCGFLDKAQILNMKAEDYLKRSIDYPYYAGKPFDFISVCPPYQLVSYPELFDLLSRSPLVNEKTFIVVEYPIEFKYQIPDQLNTALGGVLEKFRDRSYGRTWVAVYGPTESESARINPNRRDASKKKRTTDIDAFRKRHEEGDISNDTKDNRRG